MRSESFILMLHGEENNSFATNHGIRASTFYTFENQGQNVLMNSNAISK